MFLFSSFKNIASVTVESDMFVFFTVWEDRTFLKVVGRRSKIDAEKAALHEASQAIQICTK